jgi:hypothetical protein
MREHSSVGNLIVYTDTVPHRNILLDAT